MPMTLMGPPLRVKLVKAFYAGFEGSTTPLPRGEKHASSRSFTHRQLNRCPRNRRLIRSSFVGDRSHQQPDGACVWMPACKHEPPLLPRRSRVSFVSELRRAATVQYREVGNDWQLLLRPTPNAPDPRCVSLVLQVTHNNPTPKLLRSHSAWTACGH